MSFVALVLALLIEQARPLPDGNALHRGLAHWHEWLQHLLHPVDRRGGWLVWSLAVGLPALLVVVIHWALLHTLGWFLAMAWTCLVLYACLGFRQFSHHFSVVRDALASGQYEDAGAALAHWQGVDRAPTEPAELTRQLIEHAVLASHRHVFGVIFWFSVLAALGLGPLGAVVFRLSEFFTHTDDVTHDPVAGVGSVDLDIHERAWHVVDWVSVRVTALMFAISGNFEDAMDTWRTQAMRQSLSNDEVLICATSGAIGVQLGAPLKGGPEALASSESGLHAAQPQRPQPQHLRSLVGLVWRTVVAWVVLLGLLTLSRLLG